MKSPISCLKCMKRKDFDGSLFCFPKFSFILSFFFLQAFLLTNGQPKPDAEVVLSQNSGRIINDILEIFAPSNDAPSSSQDEPGLPFGFNKILARSPSTQNAVPLVEPSRISPLGPTSSVRRSPPQVVATPWADLAKECFFYAELAESFSAFEHSSPALFPFTLPTPPPPPPNPLLSFLSPPTTTPSSIFGHLTAMFNKNEPEKGAEPEIDTGGRNFDRLVIREKDTGGDLLSTLVGASGRKGDYIHDRSVDIPVQRWFDMANNLVNAYQNPAQ
uniref:Uncharacterized protein n=1 Tax=Ditylenchus dipsaci TaxID=166011 RepID=A0A915DSW7_9BILA